MKIETKSNSIESMLDIENLAVNAILNNPIYSDGAPAMILTNAISTIYLVKATLSRVGLTNNEPFEYDDFEKCVREGFEDACRAFREKFYKGEIPIGQNTDGANE